MTKSDVHTLPKGIQVPNHIAIVLDGNGRWARARNLPATNGHAVAADHLQNTIRAVRNFGVHTLTLWGFSTENWRRSPKEVSSILSLVAQYLKTTLPEAKTDGVRFHHLGRKDRLPSELLKLLEKAEQETAHNDKYILNLALDYGGRDEIIRAIKKIVVSDIEPEKINEDLVSSYLDTAGQPYPDPDLFIRPSGEQRTSGLMPWQMVYSEFYFEQVHLPDLGPEKIKEAILDYSRRRRRFGAKDHIYHFKFEPVNIAKSEIAWWKLANVPENTHLRDYAVAHLQEKYQLSKELALTAAKFLLEALRERNNKKWDKSLKAAEQFYQLLKSEIKLAFDPAVVASLQIKFWQELEKRDIPTNVAELETIAQHLIAEIFRISLFQASKTAHLETLANVEYKLATRSRGSVHWSKAEDYLQKSYVALKECVA